MCAWLYSGFSERQISLPVSAETGKLIWRSLKPEYSHAHIESIASNQETLFVARWDWNLTAYKLGTGEIIWEKSITGRDYPYIVSDGNSVYLGKGQLVKAFEARSGLLQWEIDFGGYSGALVLD